MKVYDLIRQLVKLEPGLEVFVQRAEQAKGRRQRILSVARPHINHRQDPCPDEAVLLTDWEPTDEKA